LTIGVPGAINADAAGAAGWEEREMTWIT